MNHYPHTTAATVAPLQGRFLMVQEKSGESLVYKQPAGHVEVGKGLISGARAAYAVAAPMAAALL